MQIHISHISLTYRYRTISQYRNLFREFCGGYSTWNLNQLNIATKHLHKGSVARPSAVHVRYCN